MCNWVAHLYIKTKIVCVGLYEKRFFALLAVDDTYTAGVYSYLCRVILRKCVGYIQKGRINVLLTYYWVVTTQQKDCY